MPELGKEIFAGDLIISPGGSAIVAIGLHRLGAKVGLIADLGSDPLSKLIWEQLGDLGLDRSLITQHPYPLPQVTVALSFPEDRAFVTRFQRPEKYPNLKSILQANPTKHLHLCSFLTALDAPEYPQIAHAAGATISMDPGWDEIALQNTKLKTKKNENVIGSQFLTDGRIEKFIASLKERGIIGGVNVEEYKTIFENIKILTDDIWEEELLTIKKDWEKHINKKSIEKIKEVIKTRDIESKVSKNLINSKNGKKLLESLADS